MAYASRGSRRLAIRLATAVGAASACLKFRFVSCPLQARVLTGSRRDAWAIYHWPVLMRVQTLVRRRS
jgi:hypothetical protein